MKNLIKKVKRSDPRVSTQEIEISPYALNCTRCGLVVLSPREGWDLECQPSNEMTCPVCKGVGRADVGAALNWNTQAKKFLWADLYY
jgi:hypothetical protein